MKNSKITQTIGFYSIFLGISVLCMWSFILLTEPIQEGKNEMTFHLVSEFIMAVLCILSGLTLLKKRKKNLNIAAHAMVIYSVLNAAGYYAERGDKAMIILFVILGIISSIVLGYQLFLPDKSSK